jgi:hypothetical protein
MKLKLEADEMERERLLADLGTLRQQRPVTCDELDLCWRTLAQKSVPDIRVWQSEQDEIENQLLEQEELCLQEAAVKSDEDAYFTKMMSPSHHDEHNPEHECLKECEICLDELDGDQKVWNLPCGHVFHIDCARVWLRRTPACPLCSAPTDLTQLQQLHSDPAEKPHVAPSASSPDGLVVFQVNDDQITRATINTSCGCCLGKSCEHTSSFTTSTNTSSNISIGISTSSTSGVNTNYNFGKTGNTAINNKSGSWATDASTVGIDATNNSRILVEQTDRERGH